MKNDREFSADTLWFMAACCRFSNRDLFTIASDKSAATSLSGAALLQAIESTASMLVAHVRPQQRVLLFFPHGLEYLGALLACWRVNAVAVPVPLLEFSQASAVTASLTSIANAAKVDWLLTNEAGRRIASELPELARIPALLIEDGSPDSRCAAYIGRHDDTATLLFTSGSTAAPKGIVLSHAQMLAQAKAGAAQWEMRHTSRIVSWMPLFHNFGMHFGLLAPLQAGATSVLLSPSLYSRRPQTWLESLHRYRATHTAAPNFAFDVVSNHIDPSSVSDLSLRSLRAIICGGEPIRELTYARFIETFRRYGLKPSAFRAHYGLSETGAVATRSARVPRFIALDIARLQRGQVVLAQDGAPNVTAIDCGEPGDGIQLCIADPDTLQRCEPNRIGEVWVRGPTVAQGYWQQEAATREIDHATLAGHPQETFLRTGDLGFLRENALYIVGRRKDVMIVRGKNHHPIDVELTIRRRLPQLTHGPLVFSGELDGEERVIVVQPVNAAEESLDFASSAKSIVAAASVNHGLELYDVCFVREHEVPKTGSGKVRRHSCKDAYLRSTLAMMYATREKIGAARGDADHPALFALALNRTLRLVQDAFSKELGRVPGERQPLGELGLSSLQCARIANDIESKSGVACSPVLLFKYGDITQLACYLDHSSRRGDVESESNAAAPSRQSSESLSTIDPMQTAIVGVYGKFPGADSVEELARNMRVGKNAIARIAEARPIILALDAEAEGRAETFPSWAGFIGDADTFDAEFFGVARVEAECMDPQQRKMLELTWATFEAAGYNPREFRGRKVAVFAAAHNCDYADVIGAAARASQTYGAFLDSGVHMSMIANRASRWFDFRGPSELVNTACSSSLVAVGRAVAALKAGECELALVAGINLIFSPRVFRAAHSAGMLAPDGQCKTLDARADGFVRAEAVAGMLLKPLRDAKAAGDTIHGVLESAVVNHDGHSNSLRAPNLQAQKELIKSAMDRAGVAARDVDYIELHGTGTALGDPIELRALQEAFFELGAASREVPCALGSAKTHIGHCESAAGLVGIINVLLALRHEVLPSNLHFNALNPQVDLKPNAFDVLTENRPWPRRRGSTSADSVRRAGISSFGFGGSNAHVVVADSRTASSDAIELQTDVAGPVFILLSAKSEDRLQVQARQLAQHLDEVAYDSAELSSIAYTLQVGRHAMEYRLAIATTSIDDLKVKLHSYLNAGRGQREGVDCYVGRATENECIGLLSAEEKIQATLIQLARTEKYSSLLRSWTQGLFIDWKLMYADGVRPRRIELPTYPFVRERYWIASDERGRDSLIRFSKESMLPLASNASGTVETSLEVSVRLDPSDFFLRDHMVDGRSVLPAAYYLELVATVFRSRPNIETFDETRPLRVDQVVWRAPLIVAAAREVRLRLLAIGQDEYEFEVFDPDAPNLDAEGYLVHAQGRVCRSSEFRESARATARHDITALLARCDIRIDAERLYRLFATRGIEFGPAHRSVTFLASGLGGDGVQFAIGRLILPAGAAIGTRSYILHPSVTDGALQVSEGLFIRSEGSDPKTSRPLRLPFAIRQVEILRPTPASAWAVVVARDAAEKPSSVDIDICDDSGEVCVRLKGLVLRTIQRPDTQPDRTPCVMTFAPRWHERQVANAPMPQRFCEHWVLTDVGDLASIDALRRQYPAIRWEALQRGGTVDERVLTVAEQVFRRIRSIMESKPSLPVSVQVLIGMDAGEDLLLGAVSGLLRSAHIENPNIVSQTISLPRHVSMEVIAHCIDDILTSPLGGVARRIGDGDETLEFVELSDTIASDDDALTRDMPWKDGGVYLITGGGGGIGLLLASEMASRARGAKIFLAGRSGMTERRHALVAACRHNEAVVEYVVLDVTDAAAVERVVADIVAKCGRLDGVIHAAGVIQDGFLINKTIEEFRDVLAPKIRGTVNLDHATQRMELDFFLLFSSVAGAFGNIGQGDYACGNAFMDRYAEYRDALRRQGARHGRSLAINWPYWADGGMWLPDGVQRSLEAQGLFALSTPAAMAALYRAYTCGDTNVVVLAGTRAAVRAWVKAISHRTSESREVVAANPSLMDTVRDYVRNALAAILRLQVERLDIDTTFDALGVDSIIALRAVQELEKRFGRLSKTLLFEYRSVSALAQYLVERHGDDSQARFDAQGSRLAPATSNQAASPHAETDQGGIAIIGMAGRFPRARDLDEYWSNLRSGRDCITEIPRDRWDYREFFDAEKVKPGKSYSKWGGFIDGIDEFDAQFFHISPREAEYIDPQERLFLECAYQTLEDAGYTRAPVDGSGELRPEGNVGVFVGSMYDEYALHGAEAHALGGAYALGGNPASIANRVSFFCNFHGPSMVVNTMCSSSLTAIHLACQSLRLGQCEKAIAGGVNLSIHPNKYLTLSQGQFASSTGRCASFGAGGDGYVPGEGVGAVLLKPLGKAIDDGDRIIGVIRSTSVNHGGRTNGYTVPNPQAQAQVVERALRDAGVDPRAITYVEAHGTGTSLGDPVEVAGLATAFSGFTRDRQFCGIGSVKSNIGHTEGAAGVAGLLKVLLQMQHGYLVPSLHSREINPHIEFATTPFRLQHALEEWRRPVVRVNGQQREGNRIAGVSAFGAGGANAHLILEEYRAPNRNANDACVQLRHPALIVLSAKTEDRLRARAKQLADHFARQDVCDADLRDIAYTLQLGREPMDSRLAFTASKLSVALTKLNGYLSGADQSGQIATHFSGQREVAGRSTYCSSAERIDAQDRWIADGSYGELLDSWVRGFSVDWERLYRKEASINARPCRVRLPTYSFAKTRYWLSAFRTASTPPQSLRSEAARADHESANLDQDALHKSHADVEPQASDFQLRQPTATTEETTNRKARTDDSTQHAYERCIADLKNWMGDWLKTSHQSLRDDDHFLELGFDSIGLRTLTRWIATDWQINLPQSALYRHSTLSTLVEYLFVEFGDVVRQRYVPTLTVDSKRADTVILTDSDSSATECKKCATDSRADMSIGTVSDELFERYRRGDLAEEALARLIDSGALV